MNGDRFDRLKQLYSSEKNYLSRRLLPKADFNIANLLGELFCPGPFYYYIFDAPSLTFDQVSTTLPKVLGYDHENFHLKDLINIIHPEDIQFVMKCEERVAKFVTEKLSPEEIFDYKFCYNFRQQRADGVYRHFFMQTIVMKTEIDGALLKIFGVHTDISDFGPVMNRNLYIHGSNGAPSFRINDVWEGELIASSASQLKISKREIEVASLMAEGLTSKEIANRLHISEETVISHKKNLLKKTGSKNAVELISNLVRNAWI